MKFLVEKASIRQFEKSPTEIWQTEIGYHTRGRGVYPHWTVNIETLEELVEFSRAEGSKQWEFQIIVSPESEDELLPKITIYDDYLE
jgi:hypothetical protein